MKEKNKTLLTCTAAHYLNDAYGMILPALIPLIIPLFNLTYFEAGLAFTLILITGSILQPVMGNLADTKDQRKLILVGGMLLFGASISLLGTAPNFVIFLILCFLAGIGMSTYHAMGVIFISYHFGDKKGKALGIHGVGGSFGHFSGPIFVAILVSPIFLAIFGKYNIDWRLGLVFTVIPAVVVAVASWLILQEPNIKKNQKKKFIFGSITLPIILLGVVMAIRGGVYRGFVTFLPSFFVERGLTVFLAGVLTGVLLSAGIIAQPIGGYISDKLGRKNVLFISLIFTGPFIFLFTFLPFTIMSLLLLFLIGFCIFLSFPIGLAFAAELGEEKMGETLGIVFGIGMGAASVIPALMGIMIDLVGFYQSFYILAVLAVVSAILTLFLPKK